MENGKNDILTIEEAAELLKLSTKTIYRMVRENKLKASKIGRVWRIKKSDIDDYLSQNSNQNTNQ